MKTAKLMLVAAASCMSIAPTIATAAAPTASSRAASANPAAPLSLSGPVRTSTDVEGSKAVSGGLYAALVIIGVAAIGVLAFTGDDGEPDSN